MLQVLNVKKEYKTNGFVQRALNDVSLNFRENEFVAILGPSGSGKTTLLNIVGGLDKYDDGDIIINGISTKNYKDKDWDSYRNHSIGFVFQSYNLIPHQNILSNVELSLTISGISKKERKIRAKEALEKVGLGEHLHKLPNQLSGGQMQRVAIARALVNDPTILLADEPTGALDSTTSVQIMDLLKEVASDRLVIMVTHNPELAEEYATRVIQLKDGEIVSDSNPVSEDEMLESEAIHKNMGKSSMSFFTALSLSFKNLLTKKARTILVAVAGSIGIIGIALILAISNGVNNYIADIEEDTLSEYPIELSSSSFSLAGLFERGGQTDRENGVVTEISIITDIFTKLSTNDLESFKTYIESDECDLSPYTKHIEYKYDITPLIFTTSEEEIRQVNPYDVMSIFNNDFTTFYSGFSSFSLSMTDVFHEMPSNEDLYKEQYQVEAGHWPEKYNECVLVLTESGAVSDLTLYACGVKDDTALREAMEKYKTSGALSMETIGEEDDSHPNIQYPYSDFIGKEFKLVLPSDCYTYDSEYDIWTSKIANQDYMKQVIADSETMKIVGIVKPVEGSSGTMLSMGLSYPYSLTEHIIEQSENSEIVQSQIASPDIDVLTGKHFSSKESTVPDLSSLFDIDEEKMKNAFNINDGFNIESFMPDDFDISTMFDNIDISNISFDNIDFSQIDFNLPAIDVNNIDFSTVDMPDISREELVNLLKTIKLDISEEELRSTAQEIRDSYIAFAQASPEGDITKLPEAIASFLATDDAKNIIKEGIQNILSGIPESLAREDLSVASALIAEGFPAWAEANGYNDMEHYSEDIQAYLSSDYVVGILQNTLAEFLTNAINNISDSDIALLVQNLNTAYDTYAKEQLLPNADAIQVTLTNYLNSEEFFNIIDRNILSKIDASELEVQIQQMIVDFIASYIASMNESFSSILSDYSASISGTIAAVVAQQMSGVIANISSSIQTAISTYMESMFAQFNDFSNFEELFSFDEEMFKDAITANFDQNELADMLSSFFTSTSSTYAGNLKKFGYADKNSPSSILIYPKSFENKAKVVEEIDKYNEKMLENGEEEKIIEFTDMVGTLMSSITTIINAISYVLIAFVSVSLIVSSIMIGVITYISVLERRKEIGILRSLGASKVNVSNVFNAETIITGFLAGLIGVGFTYLFMIPGNAILRSVTEQQNLAAYLPPSSALILILLSVVLTLIGGLIPSSKAAHSDPVTALRTE